MVAQSDEAVRCDDAQICQPCFRARSYQGTSSNAGGIALADRLRAAIWRLLRLGGEPGLYRLIRPRGLAHRRWQALSQLFQVRAGRLATGHPRPHRQRRRQLAQGPGIVLAFSGIRVEAARSISSCCEPASCRAGCASQRLARASAVRRRLCRYHPTLFS